MPHRLLPLLAVALCLAPGTWLRTEVPLRHNVPVSVRAVNEPGAPLPEGWALEGVWEYSGTGQHFGGFSALLALADSRLRAFSDRGARLTIAAPDTLEPPLAKASATSAVGRLAYQASYKGYGAQLWDIESATRDPISGQYWLGHEFFHAIQRYDVASRPTGLRILEDEVSWSSNSGLEAMVRLRDGRFVAIPESGREVLVYPQDPIEGAQPERLTYVSPQSGFGITDAAELPDGRLLILLRRVLWNVPPFEGRIAVAKLPMSGEPQELRPQFVLDLTAVAPRDNYEGLAITERDDGAVRVWVISDDNFSSLQRTLLLKLRLDPALLRPLDDPPADAKQKARE